MANNIEFNGPIPGENYVHDTKNFPWHRPPDFTDFDEAVEFCLDQIMEEEVNLTFMAFIEIGMSITTATSIYLTMGVAQGRWTIDYAILLAGPVSRIFEIMAKVHGIKFKLGTEGKAPVITAALLKKYSGAEDTVEVPPVEALPPVTTDPAMGLGMGLGAAPKSEQDAMLGYVDEEPVLTPEEQQGAM